MAARREARGLGSYPGTIPPTLDAAYRVQDAAIALDGSTIGGWKVGKIDPPVDGANRLAGPIFTHLITADGDTPVAMPVFAEGFAAAEAEFLLRIGTPPPPGKTQFTTEEAIAHIDAVHLGIEIASSPLGAINDLGPAVTISDFGNNCGLVVGAAIPDWRETDIAAWPVALLVNGQQVGAARAAAMLDGPFGAARFLFESLAGRGIALTRGQWISSGAVTGVHAVTIGDTVEAHFNDNHVVRCTIRAAS
ncbi:2-keto-4-pentenoate hydratase [Hephaestia sp. MAHUQ-44]|uniref:2-keto-4-pentenoate hydratase n=1 Tax=Hephaestia sp. MAHUQ-44 TaxID=2952526 RepID=UPI002076EE2B|nr:2-keto-4-pentenoate hydratase [Hephaestia sp. MAHUQ-44]